MFTPWEAAHTSNCQPENFESMYLGEHMISVSICVFAVFAIIIPAFFAIMQAYVYIHSCNLTYMSEAISTDRSKYPYLALSICQSATHICGERTMVAYSKDVYEALVAAAL